MKKKPNAPEFDFSTARWPAAEEFPLNEKQQNSNVQKVLRPDIYTTEDDFLIITGYTSLSEIVSTFGVAEYNGKAKIRIVFGVEPQASNRTKWKRALLHEDIESYWWRQGISPFKCGMVLALIDHIEKKRVCFRIKDELHAKIYASKDVAMMGSSNFSHNGLTQLHEANIRVRADGAGSQPHQQAALKKIAENFYEEALPFNEKIISLLRRLMQVVDWDEALARAIAAVLEGHFLDSYPTLHNRLNDLDLWPSQMLGIYQGLNILQNHGSILVADPTGSGKTKMICAIQLALVHWLWEIGQQDRANGLSITPPAVRRSWDKEQNASGRILREPVSHGILSRPKAPGYARIIGLLKQANILVLDEAHNYLSTTSDRSQAVAEHEASFSILATATPINKKAEDLLRLIELLDADNLGDAELDKFKRLYEHKISAEEEADTEGTLQALRSYIWQFTLRRTKKEINELVAKEPDKYRNDLKKRCRYPQVTNREYATGEDEADIEAARNILTEAANLRGLIFLKKLRPPVWKSFDSLEAKQAYVEGRLRAAKALAQYRVQAMLRSSRAALYEHILGTAAANKEFKLKNAPKNTETGYVIRTLRARIAHDQGIPCDTSFERAALPDWLVDWERFQAVCKDEVNTYQKIIQHLAKVSDKRERTKAKHLIHCLSSHDLVVAFDHTIITLYQLAELLREEGANYRLATAEQTKVSLENVMDEFGLHSKKKGTIALCSDAMSEGVNMQRASAVIMLDMPSILRLAEQRIGRIDRMDSPHKMIEVHWPADSEVFALRADARLFKTTHLTRRLLGSNLTLPEEFNKRFEELAVMTTPEIVSAVEESRKEDDKTWEGVQDAFSEVRALKEGDRAIIKETLYKDMSKTKASVRCRLSFVQAQSQWAFIATIGTERRPPRWIFIDETENVQTQFSEVANLLRERLRDVEKADFSQADLNRFLALYKDNERKTLPYKKRRALQTAEHLLDRQLAFEEKNKNVEGASLVREVLNLFRHGLEIKDAIIDYHLFAQQWLELLSPKLREKRAQVRFKHKRQYIGLDDLKTRKREIHFTTIELQQIRDNVPLTDPLDHQIAACIVGVRKPVTNQQNDIVGVSLSSEGIA